MNFQRDDSFDQNQICVLSCSIDIELTMMMMMNCPFVLNMGNVYDVHHIPEMTAESFTLIISLTQYPRQYIRRLNSSEDVNIPLRRRELFLCEDTLNVALFCLYPN